MKHCNTIWLSPASPPRVIAQLRAQQLALANNPTWLAYNERLFDDPHKARMPEE